MQRGAGPPLAPPGVIVIGNLTLDDVVLPDGTTHMGVIGGASLYAALGARLWRADIGLVARRGEDFPPQHLDRLRALGLALDGVNDIPGPTLRNWIVYESDGRRHGIFRTPPERPLEVAARPQDIPAGWLAAERPPHVHVAAMRTDAAEALVDRLRRDAPSCVITLDTHGEYVADYRERLLALAAKVDAFMPSREELAVLVGYDDPARAVIELATLPTPVIIVKLGPDGCLVRDARSGLVHRVGVSKVAAVDATGAGDAFCGGFLAGLAEGLEPVEAARRGAVSAAFAVTDFGSLALASVTAAMARERLELAPPPVDLQPASARPEAKQESPDRRAIELMRAEIDTVPSVIENSAGALAARLDELADSLEADGIDHLFLSGCGDSWFAGMGACLAFGRYAGVPTEAVHALELARYRVRYLPPRSAVVCVSYSGEAGRTIEAAAQAREHGHRVIALTGNPDGRLAREVDTHLLIDAPTLGGTPGTSTYTASQSALMLLAASWGTWRGRSPDVAGALTAAAAVARETITGALEPARAFAEKLPAHPWITFLGAGPNEATARFGAAKMMEGPQVLGVSTNTEEFAHEEYFVTTKRSPVVLIAPSGSSSDRAHEILSELVYIGAEVAWVSDEQPPYAEVTWLPLAAGTPEELSPLVAALPLSLVAFFLAEATGKRSYNFPSADAEREHYETIHRDTRGTPA
ncbi:MAG TPA: PfkB family carbohydrate kinase [Solirubrobacteraceae bacterium]|nr:PfkB family carbohydrate kinase [Solirubrobacteraceae bacterium]